MMRRVLLQGLLPLLFTLPHAKGGGFDIFDGEGLELKADLKKTEVEEAAAAESKDEVFGDEKLIREFLTKASAARREQMEKDLAKVVDELEKDASPDAPAKQKIEALGKPAIDAAVAAWEVKCREWIMSVVNQGAELEEVIKNWNPEQVAANNQVVSVAAPEETAEWRDGLKQILTPGQWAAREEKQNARMEKLRKDFGDYLASSEAQAGEVMATGMDSLLNGIFLYGGIEEERRGKLKQAADEAVKVALAAWRVRAEKQLLKMDDSAREQLMQRNGLIGVDASEKANKPQEQPAWKDAFAQILTDAERTQIEERQRSIRGRRAEALGMVLLADLDRLIGFQEKQRAGLLELMRKPLEGLPAHYFESPGGQGYYSIDLPQLLRQIRSISDSQISALLDASQMKRWKALSPGQLSRNNGYMAERLETGEAPPAAEMDEVEVERLLSGFLHKEARKMKKKMQTVMESQVENIRRVVQPAPEAVTVLNTAAKGAAEEMAMGSINNLTVWVRAQFQSLKPSDVPARFQNLSNPYFNERQLPKEPKIWTAAVERLLTPAQREAWAAECAAREKWRARGVSAIVLTELEKRFPLKPEQREALDTKLQEVIAGYEPEFANYFSSNWYLQGYYSLVPLAIPTDKELGEIFDKKELESIKEKHLGNALQYAEMLRRNHKSRTGK